MSYYEDLEEPPNTSIFRRPIVDPTLGGQILPPPIAPRERPRADRLIPRRILQRGSDVVGKEPLREALGQHNILDRLLGVIQGIPQQLVESTQTASRQDATPDERLEGLISGMGFGMGRAFPLTTSRTARIQPRIELSPALRQTPEIQSTIREAPTIRDLTDTPGVARTIVPEREFRRRTGDIFDEHAANARGAVTIGEPGNRNIIRGNEYNDALSRRLTQQERRSEHQFRVFQGGRDVGADEAFNALNVARRSLDLPEMPRVDFDRLPINRRFTGSGETVPPPASSDAFHRINVARFERELPPLTRQQFDEMISGGASSHEIINANAGNIIPTNPRGWGQRQQPENLEREIQYLTKLREQIQALDRNISTGLKIIPNDPRFLSQREMLDRYVLMYERRLNELENKLDLQIGKHKPHTVPGSAEQRVASGRLEPTSGFGELDPRTRMRGDRFGPGARGPGNQMTDTLRQLQTKGVRVPREARDTIDKVTNWLTESGVPHTIKQDKGGSVYINIIDRHAGITNPLTRNLDVRVPIDRHIGIPDRTKIGRRFDTGDILANPRHIENKGLTRNVGGESYRDADVLIDALRHRLSTDPSGQFLISPSKAPRYSTNMPEAVQRVRSTEQLDLPLSLPPSRQTRFSFAESDLGVSPPNRISPDWMRRTQREVTPSELRDAGQRVFTNFFSGPPTQRRMHGHHLANIDDRVYNRILGEPDIGLRGLQTQELKGGTHGGPLQYREPLVSEFIVSLRDRGTPYTQIARRLNDLLTPKIKYDADGVRRAFIREDGIRRGVMASKVYGYGGSTREPTHPIRISPRGEDFTNIAPMQEVREYLTRLGPEGLRRQREEVRRRTPAVTVRRKTPEEAN